MIFIKRNGKKRRLARGVTLIEVMIVVTILAMVAGGVAIFALPQFRKAQLKTATTAATTIRQAVQTWQSTNVSSECPTVSQLTEDKTLDPGTDTNDPWGQPFAISCVDDDVVVSSKGPDTKKGTADDIAVPKGRAAPEAEAP
jgi:general secretion pathway protein G